MSEWESARKIQVNDANEKRQKYQRLRFAFWRPTINDPTRSR